MSKITNKGEYRVQLAGTEAQWNKRLEDIRKRNHIIVQEGKYLQTYFTIGGESAYRYWAKVKIPMEA